MEPIIKFQLGRPRNPTKAVSERRLRNIQFSRRQNQIKETYKAITMADMQDKTGTDRSHKSSSTRNGSDWG